MTTNRSKIKTKEQFQDLIDSNNTILIHFELAGWNVCHDVYPRVLDIVNSFGIPIGTIDINEVKEVAGQNLVFTIPTILVFNEGKEVLRESRFIDFENIKRILSLLK